MPEGTGEKENPRIIMSGSLDLYGVPASKYPTFSDEIIARKEKPRHRIQQEVATNAIDLSSTRKP
jgi:hypothetical protein